MPHSQNIIHVNEPDFQLEVLAHSAQQPVVVDFWAEWCVPCKTLDPILERLADESLGTFRLAKVDVDANPKLTAEYGVQGIPYVKAFRNGQVFSEFSGLRPEPQIREFIKALAPATFDLGVGRANNLLLNKNWQQAENAFRQILNNNPDQPEALLGLSKCLLLRGDASGALSILHAFPVSKQYSAAEQLIPLAEAMAETDGSETDNLFPTFSNTLFLVGRGQVPAALDGMIDLLREDKNYRRGTCRKVAIGILALLADEDPLARQYRTELASLLFS